MPASMTGSSLLRAALCPPSHALPAVSTDSAEARRGRGVHAYLDALAKGVDPETALLEVPLSLHTQCAAIDTTNVPHGEPEVALAFDLRQGTVRRLPATRHRDYSAALPHEITGTADLLVPPSSEANGVPLVIDWKTTAWELDVETCRMQLAFYGLCCARLYDAPSVRCGIAEINPRGEVEWHRWTLDFEDLADIANTLRDTAARVAKARAQFDALSLEDRKAWTPDLVEGAHCRYCPSWRYCPAKSAAITASLDIARGGSFDLTDVARAWVRAKEADRALEVLRPILERALDEHKVVEVGDGRAIHRDGRGAIRVASEGHLARKGGRAA